MTRQSRGADERMDAIGRARLCLAAAVAAVLTMAACSSEPLTTASASVPSPSGATPTVESSSSPTPDASVGPTPCVAPVTVDVLGGWSAEWPRPTIVACVGSRELAVVGYLAPAWGIGGIGNGVMPAWLGDEFGLSQVLWLKPRNADGCFAEDDCIWMFIHAQDPAALPLTPDRWVAVTGHFDDPAATTCHWVGPSGAPLTTAQAVEVCREHFVVTGIADAAAPSPLP